MYAIRSYYGSQQPGRAGEPAPVRAPAPGGASLDRNLAVLVVDDDESSREFQREVLGSYNFV